MLVGIVIGFAAVMFTVELVTLLTSKKELPPLQRSDRPSDDTLLHIYQVRGNMYRLIEELEERALEHDRSKTENFEKPAFDAASKLSELTYGSREYKDSLDELGPALDHHYAVNRHHPEHFANGVDDMTLIDLTEMFCDWCSATERHDDGDIMFSLKHNTDRFKMDKQLYRILYNTAMEYRMGKYDWRNTA